MTGLEVDSFSAVAAAAAAALLVLLLSIGSAAGTAPTLWLSASPSSGEIRRALLLEARLERCIFVGEGDLDCVDGADTPPVGSPATDVGRTSSGLGVGGSLRFPRAAAAIATLGELDGTC